MSKRTRRNGDPAFEASVRCVCCQSSPSLILQGAECRLYCRLLSKELKGPEKVDADQGRHRASCDITKPCPHRLFWLCWVLAASVTGHD
jgi:hypothetical protein